MESVTGVIKVWKVNKYNNYNESFIVFIFLYLRDSRT